MVAKHGLPYYEVCLWKSNYTHRNLYGIHLLVSSFALCRHVYYLANKAKGLMAKMTNIARLILYALHCSIFARH